MARQYTATYTGAGELSIVYYTDSELPEPTEPRFVSVYATYENAKEAANGFNTEAHRDEAIRAIENFHTVNPPSDTIRAMLKTVKAFTQPFENMLWDRGETEYQIADKQREDAAKLLYFKDRAEAREAREALEAKRKADAEAAAAEGEKAAD